ncbi:hypothetical protein [Massilia sp. IC2-476]|uniref:hypothetical protein n=1 Tax=Massilia sp. IC2-476 TaxID=2887199 RepID=UPI001D10B17C|nr:hypothetical protein [Massilia sp. IC2-476]MCC2973518.1 hypothetical protein [Massilia sp. IC2-476]
MDEQIQAQMQRMQTLDAEERYGELLAYLQELYAATEALPAPARTDYFMTLFQWKMLIEKYPPAAEALARARDEQARRLLAGEYHVGSAPHDPMHFQRADRVALMVEMNRTLEDPGATRAVFLQLEASDPALARRDAYRMLEAIVEAGDFALGERYRGDPLALLRDVNVNAQSMPLFPPGRQAPRLAAELSNLTKDVRIAIAVLCGLQREDEAHALRRALLDGLANDELRAMAERELDVPGTIFGIHAERQTALDEAGG